MTALIVAALGYVAVGFLFLACAVDIVLENRPTEAPLWAWCVVNGILITALWPTILIGVALAEVKGGRSK